jgi:hypothetical protein
MANLTHFLSLVVHWDILASLPGESKVVIAGNPFHWHRFPNDPRKGNYSVSSAHGFPARVKAVNASASPDEDFFFLTHANTCVAASGRQAGYTA